MYPAFSTASKSDGVLTRSELYTIDAFSDAKLTCASVTPLTFLSCFSIKPAQEVQCMPVINKFVLPSPLPILFSIIGVISFSFPSINLPEILNSPSSSFDIFASKLISGGNIKLLVLTISLGFKIMESYPAFLTAVKILSSLTTLSISNVASFVLKLIFIFFAPISLSSSLISISQDLQCIPVTLSSIFLCIICPF